jgi:disulfide oxidoreductase YuzD
MKTAQWKNTIKESQRKGAIKYLSLIFDSNKIKKVTRLLYKATFKIEFFKASDLIRAAHHYPFDQEDENVVSHIRKIKKSQSMEPVILVHSQEILYIADGYHRVCACYMMKNDMQVAAIRIRI